MSNINPSTLVKNPTSSLSGSINGSKSKGEQAWVSNQTSLVGRNGGSINVGNTLTNTGAIIGSLNENTPMVINAKEIVVNDLKDKDYSKNAGFGVSGITGDLKAPQTSIQYGMSDKRQDTNSTFVNTVAYENGVKVNFEERGINTSLDNAQVITKDKTIEQIDTILHTDMLNKDVRQQFVIDFLKTTTLVPQVAKGISQGLKDKDYGILGQLALNMGTNGANIVIYAKDIKKEISEILNDATLIDGKLSLNIENTSEINALLKDVLAEFGKSFYDINFVIDKDINNLMAVNDSDGRVAINLAGIGFGNVNNLLTGIVHEGGHGTYANSIIDEKAVGALTGRYIFDNNKNLVLSEDLSIKVLNDTAQYYADRGNGKLRDATGVVIVSGGATVGPFGGSGNAMAGLTIGGNLKGGGFVGTSTPLSTNIAGLIMPELSGSAGIGIGVYPFTSKSQDISGPGSDIYLQLNLGISLTLSVTLPNSNNLGSWEGWKGAGLSLSLGMGAGIGKSPPITFGQYVYDTEVTDLDEYQKKKQEEFLDNNKVEYDDITDEPYIDVFR